MSIGLTQIKLTSLVFDCNKSLAKNYVKQFLTFNFKVKLSLSALLAALLGDTDTRASKASVTIFLLCSGLQIQGLLAM